MDFLLRWYYVIDEEDNNPYNVWTRQILRELDYLKIPIGTGNVIFPSGNALKYLKDYFDKNAEYSSPYDEDPRDIRAIDFHRMVMFCKAMSIKREFLRF